MDILLDIHGNKAKLLTRYDNQRMEFQIEFTPKSGTKKIFEWSRDLEYIFVQMQEYASANRFLEHVAGSVRKDPHRFFGISHPHFETKISDPPKPVSVSVSGVLSCANGTTPSLDEYKSYLGLHPTKDCTLEWLVVEMMADTLPSQFTQHVSKNSVYWTTSDGTQSTWKHPHYDKYAQYLKMACKVFADSVLDRIYFQLKYRPVDDSPITSLIETARIYGFKLQKEPFLVHAISSDSVESTLANISSLRSLFQSVSHLYTSVHSPVCSECDQTSPTTFCFDCGDYFCDKCFVSVHDSGMRLVHSRIACDSGPCSDCVSSKSHLLCPDCNDLFCFPCFKSCHARGGRRNHSPIILVSLKSLHSLEYMKKVHENYLVMNSPWIYVCGHYYNVEKNFTLAHIPPLIYNQLPS